MNLIQLREFFRTTSGRHDLVNADFSDNGADTYINEGRKFLDRLEENQKSWASAFRYIQIDKYMATVQSCRAIKEVWVGTTTARWQLKKMKLQDLISEYLTGEPSVRTSGSPLYYSPTITRYIPEDIASADFESFLQWVEIPAGNAYEYNTILLNVPANEKLVVEVKGLYYSKELIADTDENHWSVVHPLLLYMAAMRYIEVMNRNTQGVNDWTKAIITESTSMGMDLVEEIISEQDEMEG